VPRVISFLVLLAIVLIAGAMFFQVMAQFIVPLFLAAVLVVIFKPLHQHIVQKLPDRPRLSALITTFAIMMFVLLPCTWLGWNAYSESLHVFDLLKNEENQQKWGKLFNEGSTQFLEFYNDAFGKEFNFKGMLQEVTLYIGNLLIASIEVILGLVVGMAIMMLALYYFLADGPAMISAIMKLSPLDDTYEQELLDKFGDVSRAVVVATLLAAVAQGLLAGIGYYFTLPADAPNSLLIALTMVLALVPFIGAALVWAPICIYLLLFGERIVDDQVVIGNWPAAIGLAAYCGIVVSNVDNIVKPYVLHGQSNLHPLLALLSVIGGIQALGPIGILVGPMLVAFLQALLNMLNKELQLLGKEADQQGTPVVFATAAASPSEPTPAKPAPTKSKRNKRKKKK